MAQPSITQVLTWFHSLLFRWRWELFLSDPLIFIFWIFIIVTVFVWGRVFCGWLLPLSRSLGAALQAGPGLRPQRQFHLPQALRPAEGAQVCDLLRPARRPSSAWGWPKKLAGSSPSDHLPVVGLLNRSWPYALRRRLLGLSIFTERPFCKYLCPLGAALAMPTTFRWFGLKRKS